MFTKSQLEYFSKHSSIAVACSGGVDSMVLCHLLLIHNINFSIIHCNFKLRGEDSDFDETFVRSFATQNNLKFYCTGFETLDIAKRNGNSIEMEARNLRYTYFDSIIQENKVDLVLLAHHKDDHVETILMRMITGTGLNGLMGIREYKSSHYYRPLWHWTKDKIKQYAITHKIKFTQDLSNFENNYLRNTLRNQVLPLIYQINPAYRESFNQLSEIASQSKALIDLNFKTKKEEWLHSKKIDVSDISNYEFLPIVIAYILEDLDINKSILKNIVTSIHSKEAKYFQIGNSKIEVKNGFISMVIDESLDNITFNNIDELISNSLIQATKIPMTNDYEKENLYLDLNKLSFPIIYRTMNSKDKIKGLGMNGYKSLSDIAQEMKWTTTEKTRRIIFEDDSKEIIAVLGWRISEKVKIDESTFQVLKISM